VREPSSRFGANRCVAEVDDSGSRAAAS
jgi:hypothetical protein